MQHHPLITDPTERLARKRAGAKLGWYVHAGAYLAVNLLLVVLSASSGRHWAVFPAVGWGLGLERAAQVGSVLAAYVVETVGTQEYTFTPSQFVARIEASYGVPAAGDVAKHLQ